MAYLRLRNNIQAWRDIGANNEVLSWIEKGVKIDFSSNPVSYEHANRANSQKDIDFIDSELKKLYNNGAISKVEQKPFCVNALFTTPKKNDKLRLVTDLHPLNVHVITPYFKNDGIDTVCELIKPNDLMLTVDLKDGFHHVGIHPDFRQFLGFQWRGQYYVWNVCPFGLSSSPYYFNKLIRAVVTYLRSESLRVNFWVDDGLLMEAPDEAENSKVTFMSKLEILGIYVNFDESELELSESKLYVIYY